MLTINFHFSSDQAPYGTVSEQPDKWDDVVHLIAFIPKAMINLLIWQVFWLTLFSDAFPSG